MSAADSAADSSIRALLGAAQVMKVVLVMFKDHERREFPLTSATTVIGRLQECGLRIPTRDVSRKHCEIAISGGAVTLRDLKSSNGTFLNGQIVKEARLKAGDRLTIGPVSFVIQIDGKPAAIAPADAGPRLEDTDADAAAIPLFDDEEADTEKIVELDSSDFDIDDALEAILDEEDEEDERKRKKK